MGIAIFADGLIFGVVWSHDNMKLPTRYWRYVINISFFVYVSFSLVFVFRGELNADEGWYLYAGKLVYQGWMPYHDFAYTQTPLLPYIYGGPAGGGTFTLCRPFVDGFH